MSHGTVRSRVQVGIAIEGIYDIDDRTNTWVADYWLYEAWTPTAGFRPQTEVTNELERQDEAAQSDVTEERGGKCVRWRHLRSKLFTPYDFRRFPFDTQHLELALSDGEFNSTELMYAPDPGRSKLDAAVTRDLPGWRPSGTVAYRTEQRAFDSGDEVRAKYDCATFSVSVTRRPIYHLAKFFLPLFLIVAVAFSCFWIDPDDLASQAQIGVTCLLAAIAFQLTQTGNLPQVDYLTLADRVYVACYVAIAGAIVESVYVNALARRQRREVAHRVDRVCRWVFGLGIFAAIGLATVLSMRR